MYDDFESRPVLIRYGLAVAAVIAATGVRLLLDPVLGVQSPFAILFFAVLISAWYGGFGPALLATGLGALASVWFLLPPRHVFLVDDSEKQGGLILYLTVSLSIALIGRAMRQAQRRTEKSARQLALQRELLRVTLDSIGDAVIATDARGRITSLNQVAVDLTGWTAAEAVGRPLPEVFRIQNEATRQPIENPVEKVLAEGRIVGLANHTVLVVKDGRCVPIDDSAAPIRDRLGNLVGVVLVFRDVTERRRAEEELKASEKELSDFFDNANVGLHWVGPDGLIMRVNQAELDMLGYSRAEYLGHPIAEFHADRAVIDDILTRLTAGEELRSYPARLRCRDGSIKHVLINSSVRWQHGQFMHTRCFTLDVTDRIQAEEAKALVAAIVANSDDAIISKTLDGVITSWNAGAERLFGWSAAEAIGQSIHMIIPPDKHDEERTILERLRQGERIEHFETVRAAKDGRGISISVTISPIRGHDGKIIGASKIARDLTARKRIEEALRRSEQELRLVLDAIPAVVTYVDRDSRYRFFNQTLCDWFGLAADSIRGQPVAEIMGARAYEMVRPQMEQALAGQRVHFEARLPYLHGGTRAVEARYVPDVGPDGTVHGYVGLIEDVSERKSAEAALRESEMRFRTLALNAPAAIFIKDLAGRYTLANPLACAALGQADAVGRTDHELLPAEVADQLRQHDHLVIATGRPLESEEIVRRAGLDRRFLSVKYPLLDASGQAVGVCGVAIDITDRKRAEERLVEEVRVTEALNRVSASLVAERELPRIVQTVTDEATRMAEAQFGAFFYNVHDATGESYTLYAVAGAPREAFERFAMPRNTAIFEPTFRGQGVLRLADVTQDHRYGQNAPHHGMPEGHLPVRSYLAVPVVASSGEVLGGLFLGHPQPGVFQERHEQLVVAAAAQAAIAIENARLIEGLRESEEKFRTLADNMSQFAWMADPKGWIFWYNQRWYEYTGTTLRDMEGWGWKAVHHPDHVDRVVEKVQHSWDTGEVWDDTFPLRGKDGQYRWFLSRAVPIRDATGQVLRWLGTNTDITAQREAEEALKEDDRRKDAFLATLAHELRNPLAPVRNSLEIMKLAKDDAAVVEHARATMDRQVAHLQRLVDDLLDISRITRDKIELRKEQVELASVIHQAAEACRPLAESLRHEIVLNLPAAPIHLDADPVRLAQIFSNILNNACKYMEPGGRVVLTAQLEDAARGPAVAVSVRDTGIGIPPELIPSVFDMFTQVDRSSGRSQGGLGIGLTLVRRLVEMHGGSIRAFSDGAGQGSTFVVRLPVLSGRPAVPAPAAPASVPGQRRRILVVDDNQDAAESLAQLLRLNDHETCLAHDGLAALKAAEVFQPDVILLDLGLPKLNGYDTARRIRARPWGKAILLVALTGWGQIEDRRKSAEAGFDFHLVKPVDPAFLIELLSSK